MKDDCLYNIWVDGRLAHKNVPADQVRSITERYSDTDHSIRAEMIIDNKDDYVPEQG